jgi:photosystem II stability/assembly factor-like uncharacterized protein
MLSKSIACITLAISAAAHTGTRLTSWQTSGPPGGRVQAIAVVPGAHQTIFAATDFGGIYKSTDAGAHWAAVNDGLAEASYFRAIVPDPGNASIVWAGAYSGGFKTVDGGAHWTRLALPPGAVVFSLAVVASPSSTAYAATSSNGVQKTTDGGAHWNAASNGLPSRPVNSVAVDPGNPNTAYAAINLDGVYRTIDGGASWQPTGSDLPLEGYHRVVLDPSSPSTIYAVGEIHRLSRSTNQGGGWNDITSGLPGKVTGFAIDHQTPSVLYAAVTGYGVYKSIDSGASWTPMSTGITDALVYDLAIDPASSGVLYLGTYADSVFKSSDGAAHWRQSAAGILGNQFIQSLAIDPSQPKTAYAGSDGAIFRTDDAGASWTELFRPLVIHSIAVDPGHPQKVYFASDRGVWASPDRGATWTLQSGSPGSAFRLAAAASSAGTFYLGCSSGDVRLYRTTNGGGSWTPAANGLTVDTVEDIAVDPGNANLAYVATLEEGIFRTTNGGASWTPTTRPFNGDAGFSSVAIDPTHPATVWAGGSFGLAVSHDSGESWTPALFEETALPYVNDIGIDKTGTVLAGTSLGVYESTDGEHWTPLDAGLDLHPTDLDVESLAVSVDGSYRYAGTGGGGAFSIQPARVKAVSPTPPKKVRR